MFKQNNDARRHYNQNQLLRWTSSRTWDVPRWSLVEFGTGNWINVRSKDWSQTQSDAYKGRANLQRRIEKVNWIKLEIHHVVHAVVYVKHMCRGLEENSLLCIQIAPRSPILGISFAHKKFNIFWFPFLLQVSCSKVQPSVNWNQMSCTRTTSTGRRQMDILTRTNRRRSTVALSAPTFSFSYLHCSLRNHPRSFLFLFY